MISKQNCQELIDRLSDKSLTRNCVIQQADGYKWDILGEHVLGKAPTGKYIMFHHFSGDVIFNEPIREGETILGHPIYLHDVLAKISAENYDGGNKGFVLQQKWAPLDFTRSLQEILEGAEWEVDLAALQECCCGAHERCPICELPTQIPKDPNVRNLFQFLLDLNLTKWTN